MMMSKGLISAVVVIFIAMVVAMLIYMKLSADRARKISDEYMKQFKTIEKDLQKNSKRPDSLNSINIDSLIKAMK